MLDSFGSLFDQFGSNVSGAGYATDSTPTKSTGFLQSLITTAGGAYAANQTADAAKATADANARASTLSSQLSAAAAGVSSRTWIILGIVAALVATLFLIRRK